MRRQRHSGDQSAYERENAPTNERQRHHKQGQRARKRVGSRHETRGQSAHERENTTTNDEQQSHRKAGGKAKKRVKRQEMHRRHHSAGQSAPKWAHTRTNKRFANRKKNPNKYAMLCASTVKALASELAPSGPILFQPMFSSCSVLLSCTTKHKGTQKNTVLR